MHSRIYDLTVAHRGELFAEIGRVLVFGELDDGIPAVDTESCTSISIEAYLKRREMRNSEEER